MLRALRVTVAGIALCLAARSELRAQSVQLGGALGLAAPAGFYAHNRSAGPLLRGMALFGGPQRHVRLRTDFEASWLLDPNGENPPLSNAGTLRALGGLVNMVVGSTNPRVAPYFLFGAGLQRLSVEGVRNPYGTTGSLRLGAGLEWRRRRGAVHAEIAYHVALTDFATGEDVVPGTYVPLVIGATFSP